MIRAITLTLNPETMTFDETLLMAAQEGQNVVRWDWKLVETGKEPLLMVVMETVPKRPSAPISREATDEKGKHGKGAYKDIVPEGRWELFHLLRDWRNSQAKKDGLSPYVILTNMELAMICRELPLSLAVLGEIRGIGKAKLKKYGSDILDIVARWNSRTEEAPSDDNSDGAGTEDGSDD